MQGRIRVEFRMEGCGDEIPLANGDGKAIMRDEGFHGWADRADGGRTDERERNLRSSEKGGSRVKASQLAAVGIALDRGIKNTEVNHWVVFDVPGQEDESGAGAKDWKPVDNSFTERFKEPEFAQQLPLNRRFAPRKDEPVKRSVEIPLFPDFKGNGTQLRHTPFMFNERALKCKNAYSHDRLPVGFWLLDEEEATA